MKRKLITVCVIFNIMLVSFISTSCQENVKNYGKINTVDIAKSSSAFIEKNNIFKKNKTPYDYSYTTITNSKAKMSIDIPSTWTARNINSSYMEFVSPSTDGYIPNLHVNILFRYGDDVKKTASMTTTDINKAYYFSSYFKSQLLGMPFEIDNYTYNLREYKGESEIRNHPKFAKKHHKSDAATLVYENSIFRSVNKTGIYQSGTMICSYIKWQNFPVCICTAVDKSYQKKAVSIIEYLTSSIQYSPQSSISMKQIKTNDVKFDVPSNFVPNEQADHIYKSDIDKLDSTAGMAIGIFDASNTNITSENIMSNYGVTASKILVQDGQNYQYDVVPDTDRKAPNKAYAKRVFPFYLRLTSTLDDVSKSATTANAENTSYKMDFYEKSLKGNTYLIVVMYHDVQSDIGTAVGRSILSSIRAK